MKLDKNDIDTLNGFVTSTLNCSVDDVLPHKHLYYDLLADSLTLLDLTFAN